MRFETWVPDLEDAIERHPLIAAPDASLVEVIALISQAHHPMCLLSEELAAATPPDKVACASCVLVMQNTRILGILTERDVVRLTAQAIDLQVATVADVMVHPVITLPAQSVQDIFAALFLFRRYRIRHLPIVDDQERLLGVITHESIRRVLRPANLLRFRRVSDVMTTEVIHARLTATVLQLAQLMATHRVSCIVITQLDAEANEQPVGIVTERDIVQFQALQIDLGKTKAETVMSSPLCLLSPEDSLWTAHQEMRKRRVGRLVVSWNWGKGLGIITQTSLLRVFDPMEMYGVIENLQQTLQQMQVKQADQASPDGSTWRAHQSTHPALQPSSVGQGQASTSLVPMGCDRQRLSFSLSQIYKKVQYLVVDSDLSLEERKVKLTSVLEHLEQLHREIGL